MTTIVAKIDSYILLRASHIQPGFVRTDCALALVMKKLFPGIHVHPTFMAFCNRDGYEVTIPLPDKVVNWIEDFDRTPPHLRSKMDPVKFYIDIPDKAIDSIGEYMFDHILKSNHNLWYKDYELALNAA